MSDHHTAQSGTDRFFKRMELYTVQTFASEGKYRKCFVRVYIRITMSGEVLADGKYASAFQAGSISYYLIRHPYGIFTKGTGIDDRILRVDIHIRHRSKVDLYT